MAGQIPDPRSLNSWEDAFQQPLPVVRKLEQQLRKNIDDNRQKLRSLVGASYRDLLGTAERIIEMDEQMQTVESTLGDIGRKCNARTMERVAENQGRMRKATAGRDDSRLKTMAQTMVLQNTLTMVLRLVKAGGDALQASKLLVLARLLFKSVSESPHAPAVAEELRRKLAIARKRLLTYMERTISKPISDKVLQAHSLCAYALVTSSTPKEVLRYFLQLRYKHLEQQVELPLEETMLQMLELYNQTLLDTRDLFPRRFADALAKLAKVPLLKDDQVQSAFELNLDVYGSWIAADIRSFTPWIRHEQVTSTEVGDALSSWTKSAQGCIVEGLQEFLKHQEDPRLVFDTRQKVLSKYLSLGNRMRSNMHATAIDDVRKVFLDRLLQLATKSGDLIELTLDDAAKPSRQHQAIWSMATQDYDLDHGAFKFRDSLIQSRHGRSIHIQAELRKLDTWTTRISTILDLAEEMRGSKWEQDIDFDIEEVEDSDALIDRLNKQDPKATTDKLAEATSASLRRVVDRMSGIANTTDNAAYWLRTWRELDQRRRDLQNRLQLPPSEISLTPLYQNIARFVVMDPVKAYIKSLKKPSHLALTLWDGSPPLPIQPSPCTFRLLAALQKGMEGIGSDLWSTQGVRELKIIAVAELLPQMQNVRFMKTPAGRGLTNGHVEADADAEHSNDITANDIAQVEDGGRERQLQTLFDVQYLSRVLGGRGRDQDESSLDRMIESHREALELDNAAMERLDRYAGEYWKRTYLLFGLLAPG